MSCKKLKLLLKVTCHKTLRSRFEQWKNETANFINIELSKENQEKELFRNT